MWEKKGLMVYLELMFTLFSHLRRRMQIFGSLVQVSKTISVPDERSYNFTDARTDGQEGPLAKYTSVRLHIVQRGHTVLYMTRIQMLPPNCEDKFGHPPELWKCHPHLKKWQLSEIIK